MDDEEVLVELLTEDEIRRIAAVSRGKHSMTLETAIERLEQEYERARGLSFVRNPLAYALYQVWKEADRRGGAP
ncbi:MAG: hypothetical protein IKC24_00040 [Oscillospiraceae bacterium]|nr:hypothetical protein [Oscillospiraceae bacterium]